MTNDEYIVHIVDDEEAVRTSLGFLLKIAGYTVRMHPSATSFLEKANGLGKACLVTDLRMPDMNGVELLQRLREKGETVAAIVITGQGDVPTAVAAMKAGAVDFIEKPFDDQTLIKAIERALDKLGNAEDKNPDMAWLHSRLDDLTERERQVLTSVVAGQSSKVIAYELGISQRTVEVHRANIMAKMQVRTLPELVRMAIALEIMPRHQ